MSYPDDAIYDVFQPALAIPTIWRDQNMERPAKPYATLAFGRHDPSDHLTRAPLTEDGHQDVSKWVTSTLQVQVFGKDAHRLLLDVSLRLGFTVASDSCWRGNIALGQLLSLNNVPMPIDKTQYEERAVLEMQVLWVNTLTDEPGRIEQVVIVGTDTGSAIPVSFCVGAVSSP